jgi:hypothetical protein
MPVYRCDPGIELVGQTVLSLTQNTQYESIKPLLEKYGLTEVDPQGWYSLQRVLDLLSEMSNEGNASANFVSIGMAAVEVGYIPPEMQTLSLVEFLTAYGKIYKMRHRGGAPGSVEVQTITDQHLKVILRIPYPDDVFYGIMYGYARRFRPKGTPFVVFYDEAAPRHDHGGEATIIHITWG